MEYDEYPGKCTISRTEYDELKEALTDPDNEDWKSYTESWPPEDEMGNIYPLWFTVDELNSRGELIDSNGNNFNPFTGNMEPKIVEADHDYCNTTLGNWRERYPGVRFCSIALNKDVVHDTYCYLHKNREHMVKSAEEHMQTGLWAKTVDHMYENLDPWKKLVGWGTFESLMGESSKDFAEKYEERTFNFADEDFEPAGTTPDGDLTVKVGYPTEHLDPALSLYVAAMMTVQMISVQPRIMHEDRENGQGMMESKSVETAQLTAPPSEHDPSPQEFKTLETWGEHHLNLPLSRLVTDRPKLLERGGVSIDPAEDSDGVSGDDIVLEIAADTDEVETKDEEHDPNAFGNDYTSESEKIIDSVKD